MHGCVRPGALLIAAALSFAADAYPPGYAAPGECAACHSQIAASYARTPMARTFGAVASGAKLPALPSLVHEPSGQVFTLLQRAGRMLLRRQEIGGDHALEKAVDYWIGSGNHVRSYASRTVAGDLLELPVTWYSEKQGYWAMSPAYDTPQHAGFSRRITYRCMFCHNAYPALPADADGSDNATRWPEQLPSGIDCQRCHGPGAGHIEAAKNARPAEEVRAAITNPARLDSQRSTEVCLQCHLETTNSPLPGFVRFPERSVFSFRPGERLEEYGLHFDHAPGSGHDDKFEFASAPYRLRQSACFLSSNGRMTCTTCHDPHRAKTVADYDGACRECHSSLGERHQARDRCVSCHMPRGRADDAIHVTITDHRIVREPPSLVRPDPPKERNASNTPRYNGPVGLYYPERLPDGSVHDLWLAAAQVLDQSNLQAGIGQLEEAISRWKPAGSHFYSILGNAYRAAGRNPRLLFEQALLLDPGNLAALTGLGGEAELRRALRLAPWNREIPKQLARLLTESGRVQEALQLLLGAVAADPDAGDLHNSLGLSLLRTGAVKQAEASLREAVRLRPESPAMRVNLATVLARRREWKGARREFERAIHLGPKEEIHSAYGMALMAEGDIEAAVQQHRYAVAASPGSARAHFRLGIVLGAMHLAEESRRSLQTAERLARESGDQNVQKAAEAALSPRR